MKELLISLKFALFLTLNAWGGAANATRALRDDALVVWSRSTEQVLQMRGRKAKATSTRKLLLLLN